MPAPERSKHRLAGGVAGLMCAVAIAACSTATVDPAARPGGLPTQAQALGPVTKHQGCRVHDGLPDAACTPGAVFTDVSSAVLCRRGYTERVRDVPSELKQAIYRAYGIRHHYPGEFEVDHLAPLEAEGANTDGTGYPPTADPTANLWPEPTHGAWSSHLKDEVENWARAQVCREGADALVIDRQIARDWIALYRQIGAHTLAHYRY
ncbi:MAG: hypothetical protein JO168_10880 [Solirubrobacterales bacterium]|nr:hypothetical protein [Solirubrobacterales bacterium]